MEEEEETRTSKFDFAVRHNSHKKEHWISIPPLAIASSSSYDGHTHTSYEILHGMCVRTYVRSTAAREERSVSAYYEFFFLGQDANPVSLWPGESNFRKECHSRTVGPAREGLWQYNSTWRRERAAPDNPLPPLLVCRRRLWSSEKRTLALSESGHREREKDLHKPPPSPPSLFCTS